MCDQFQLQRNIPAEISRCPSCPNCKRDSTLGSFPVQVVGMKNSYTPTYCIIRDPQCDMYWVDGQGVSRNQNGADGNDPNSVNVTPKKTQAQAQPQAQPQAKTQAPKAETQTQTAKTQTSAQKSNNNSNNNNNNNKAATNKGTSTANTNNKGVANTNNNNVISNTNNNNVIGNTNNNNVKGVSKTPGNNNNNSDINLNSNKTGNADNENETGNAGEIIQASDATISTGVDNEGKILNYEPDNITNSDNNIMIDNKTGKLPGDNNNNNNNSVSPLLIGCLSAFSILLIVVGFLYVRKRKRDEDEVDLVYSNSVFYATPIIQKDGPGSKAGSIHSNHSNRFNNSFNNGYNNVANQTAISSGNDGDYDIVIQPTAAVTDSHPALSTQRNVGPINAYADTSAYANTEDIAYDPNTSSNSLLNNSRSINVSATENFISESHINATTGIETSNVIAPTTMAGDVSVDVISPTHPNGTYQYPNQQNSQQDILIQNVSMSLDMNENSIQDQSVSFINSNGISFSNKDESCVLSPIMDKSQSNIFTADMVNENSVSDIKISSTPKLNTSVGKKTLSMVISEYKEDTLYAAKFNYEPSMEDEMRIRINDRVLVKEIFNDGWAYGENKTSESFGIFPINRLDSSS